MRIKKLIRRWFCHSDIVMIRYYATNEALIIDDLRVRPEI